MRIDAPLPKPICFLLCPALPINNLALWTPATAQIGEHFLSSTFPANASEKQAQTVIEFHLKRL